MCDEFYSIGVSQPSNENEVAGLLETNFNGIVFHFPDNVNEAWVYVSVIVEFIDSIAADKEHSESVVAAACGLIG